MFVDVLYYYDWFFCDGYGDVVIGFGELVDMCDKYLGLVEDLFLF